MHKPPGNVCCHFFNFPVRLRRTLRWCGSNCSHSTTASSIEIWPSCVNRSIKCRRACPMDVGSPLPCAQPVAFFLRRRCPKYRDTLLIPCRIIFILQIAHASPLLSCPNRDRLYALPPSSSTYCFDRISIPPEPTHGS